MGYEIFVIIGMFLEDDDYLFFYYCDWVMMLGKGMINFELVIVYFVKENLISGGW